MTKWIKRIEKDLGLLPLEFYEDLRALKISMVHPFNPSSNFSYSLGIEPSFKSLTAQIQLGTDSTLQYQKVSKNCRLWYHIAQSI